ncbi:MAG: hypothetical protein AB1472_03645 [Candidatus Omnitrophota bacterium]
MHKKIFFCFLTSIFFISICSLVFADVPKAVKAKHADKNKDGVITYREIRTEKRWERRHDIKVNTWWESRADINKNGIIESGELANWKLIEKRHIDLNHNGVIDAKEIRMCWKYAPSRVNTLLEKRYDKNNNGWLEPSEAKELFKDKYEIITTNGKAVVNTEIEYEYDTNGDGIIDIKEAEFIKEDLD